MRMGRLKQVCQIDTLAPLRRNMDAYGDAIGLTRLHGFRWEPYRSPEAPPPPSPPPPKPARVAKREAKRQQTLAQRKAEAGQPNPAIAKPAAGLGLPHTRLGIGRRLLSWSGCPVPLTAVINREVDEQDQSQDWVLVTTSTKLTANQIRSTYETSASGTSPACTLAPSRWW